VVMNFLSKTVVGATFVLTTFSMLPASSANLNFPAIYSFGDSLSDTGNAFAFSKPFTPGGVGFPPPPYFEGRFSNDPVWIDYLADDLDLEPITYASLLSDPFLSSRDGIDFAFGGALTDDRNLGKPPFPFLGLEQQVDAFADLLDGKRADSKALYTLVAGSNDYISLFGSPTPPSFADIIAQPFKTVNNLSNSITQLANLGARDIVIFNLPNLGDTPIGASNQLTANVLTGVHNFLLADKISQLQRSLPKTNLVLFDINSLFQDVLDYPDEFGFGNVTDNCTGFNFPNVDPTTPQLANCLASLQNDPKAFLFWDNQHPISAAHKIIADSVLETLESKFHPQQSVASLTLASQSLDESFIATASASVPVPEPATVPAIGLTGLLLLKKTDRKRSHS
jgi:phospholipase/lecithinase/hemolysin